MRFYKGSFISTASSIFNFTNSMFSLIVVYFIYHFANEKGWALLAFVSKLYLIVIVGVFAVLFIVMLTAFLFSISTWLSLVFRR
ncbi:MAG: hypothetical protein Q7J54_05715 [Candidatus Woesearchaeota archaeon]|nr:hypothetical protein [Candidatus Woesearchaeota archaeon]